MFAIIKDGTYLDLTGTTLRWETVNTLFEEDAFQNDYSFPFTFPLSNTNMIAFGFINEADVPKERIEFPVLLKLGDKSKPSVLIINGIGRTGFNANIAAGIKGLNNIDSKLSEVLADADEITIPDLTDLTAYKNADWENIIAFPPHYNPDFYGDNNPDFCGVVNRQNADTGAHLINTLLTGNKYCLVPWIYLHYVICYIFKKNAFSLSGNYWYDSEAATILLYNNYALDAPSTDTTSCLVKIPGTQIVEDDETYHLLQMLDTLPGAMDDDDAWDNTAFTYTVPTTDDYSFSLNVKINHIFIGFHANPVFRLYLFVKHGSDPEEQIGYTDSKNSGYNLTINYSEAFDAGDLIYAKVYVGAVGVNTASFKVVSGSFSAGLTNPAIYNGMTNVVSLKNHVPDITVSELLTNLKNFGQLDIDIDWENKTVALNYIEKVMQNPPQVDLTELSDPYPEQILEPPKGFNLNYDFGSNDALVEGNFRPYDNTRLTGYFYDRFYFGYPAFEGDFALAINTNKLWKASRNDVGSLSWEEYSDFYYPIIYGKGETERRISFAPLFMTSDATNEGTGSNVLALMPTIRETGNSQMFSLGVENEMSVRIIFMRGEYVSPSLAAKYIYAGVSQYDRANREVGSYTLVLDGQEGWYNRYLKKILIAIDNGEIFEYRIMLPLSYLVYRGKVQIKNVNYLVKNISTNIGKTVKQSVVKLLKLP